MKTGSAQKTLDIVMKFFRKTIKIVEKDKKLNERILKQV